MNEVQKTQMEMILVNHEAKAGTYIWRVGEQAKFGVIIKRGEFKFVECPEAEMGIDIKKGFFIGEMSSLINDSENTTSLQACSDDAQYFKIDRNDLIGFLRRNPGLFLAFGDSKYFVWFQLTYEEPISSYLCYSDWKSARLYIYLTLDSYLLAYIIIN